MLSMLPAELFRAERIGEVSTCAWDLLNDSGINMQEILVVLVTLISRLCTDWREGRVTMLIMLRAAVDGVAERARELVVDGGSASFRRDN